jgi:hypothetical protein
MGASKSGKGGSDMLPIFINEFVLSDSSYFHNLFRLAKLISESEDLCKHILKQDQSGYN